MSTEAKISNRLQTAEATPPSVRWWWIALRGWYVVATVALVILILAIPGYLLRRPMGSLGDHLIYEPTPFMLVVQRLNLAGGFMAVLLSYGLAALLFKKRRNDPMALFMAYYLVIHGLLFGTQLHFQHLRQAPGSRPGRGRPQGKRCGVVVAARAKVERSVPALRSPILPLASVQSE